MSDVNLDALREALAEERVDAIDDMLPDVPGWDDDRDTFLGSAGDFFLIVDAARAYLAMMEGAERLPWWCAYADQPYECFGHITSVHGCGPRLLVTPEEEI